MQSRFFFFFFAPTFLNASPIGTPLLTLGAEGSPVAQLSFFQLLVVILLRYEFWALCLNGMLKWETAVFLRHMSLSNKDMLARHYLSIRKQCQRCGGPNEGGQKKKYSHRSIHTDAQIAVVISSPTAVITAIRCEMVHLASQRTCSYKMCEYKGNIFGLDTCYSFS